MTDRGPARDRHVPVLRDRIVELLAPALQHPGAVAVDGTLGMGGHGEALLERCPQALVVGIDRDTEALGLAAERLAPFGDRFTPVHAVYDELPEVLADLGSAGRGGGPVRPRRVLPAARRGRPGFRLPRRRAAGHAHGPVERHHRRRGPQHLSAGRPGPDPARLR